MSSRAFRNIAERSETAFGVIQSLPSQRASSSTRTSIPGPDCKLRGAASISRGSCFRCTASIFSRASRSICCSASNCSVVRWLRSGTEETCMPIATLAESSSSPKRRASSSSCLSMRPIAWSAMVWFLAPRASRRISSVTRPTARSRSKSVPACISSAVSFASARLLGMCWVL